MEQEKLKIEDLPKVDEKSETPINPMLSELESKVEKLATIINAQAMPKEETEKFKSEANIKNKLVEDGRNFIKGIVQRNENIIPERFRKDFINETTNIQGGYLVPPEYYNQIQELIITSSVVRRNARVINTNSKEFFMPKLTTLPTFSFVNEGAAKPVSNVGFDQIKFSRKDGGFIVLMSKQLLEDSAFDVMSFVSNIAGKVISNVYDEAGFKGISPIKGILNPTVGATAVLIGDTFSDITYDNLIDAIAAIPSQNLPNAKWYMHRTTLSAIKKMKASTSGIYVMSAEDKKLMTLEGFPIELTDKIYGMSETAADRGLIVFGDLSQMILAERNSLGVTISDQASVVDGGSTINLWQNGLIGLNFNISFDLNFVFPEALALLKTNVTTP